MNKIYRGIIVGLSVSMASLVGMEQTNYRSNNLAQDIEKLPNDMRNLIISCIEDSYKQTDLVGLAKPKAVLNCPDAVTGVAISADGAYVVTGLHNGTAVLWDVATGKSMRTFGAYKTPIDLLAIDAESNIVATAASGYGGPVSIWDMRSGELLRDTGGKFWLARSISLDTRNRSLIVSCGMGASIIDLVTQQEQGRIAYKDFRPVYNKRLSEDLYQAFDVYADANQIKISSKSSLVVDISSFYKPIFLKGHTKYINGAALSCDDTHIVSGSEDQTALVWDISSYAHASRAINNIKQLLPQEQDRPGYPALRLFFLAKLECARNKGEKLVLYQPTYYKKAGFLWYIYQHCFAQDMRYALSKLVEFKFIDVWSISKKENLTPLIHEQRQKEIAEKERKARELELSCLSIRGSSDDEDEQE